MSLVDFQPALPLPITEPRARPKRPSRGRPRSTGRSGVKAQVARPVPVPTRTGFETDWRLDHDTRVVGRQGLKIARAALGRVTDASALGTRRHSNAA